MISINIPLVCLGHSSFSVKNIYSVRTVKKPAWDEIIIRAYTIINLKSLFLGVKMLRFCHIYRLLNL